MPKKLPKIPYSIVAYVQIEGESIRDATDKQMIVQYAYGKIEKIDWYLEILEVGSKKYTVPHTKEHLLTVREHIVAAIKVIMDRKLPKPGNAIVSVEYPKGYEG